MFVNSFKLFSTNNFKPSDSIFFKEAINFLIVYNLGTKNWIIVVTLVTTEKGPLSLISYGNLDLYSIIISFKYSLKSINNSLFFNKSL